MPDLERARQRSSISHVRDQSSLRDTARSGWGANFASRASGASAHGPVKGSAAGASRDDPANAVDRCGPLSVVELDW